MPTKSSKSLVKIDNGSEYVEVYSKDKVDQLINSFSPSIPIIKQRYLHNVLISIGSNGDYILLQLITFFENDIDNIDLLKQGITAYPSIQTQATIPATGHYSSNNEKGSISALVINDTINFSSFSDSYFILYDADVETQLEVNAGDLDIYLNASETTITDTVVPLYYN